MYITHHINEQFLNFKLNTFVKQNSFKEILQKKNYFILVDTRWPRKLFCLLNDEKSLIY